ncbi:hypothetical protein [Paracidovorax anthurii]|uniref:Uncharacterized protein n=1 Tax=Paracidovorax anthurii TaxID=78229 RepID=A0A328ZFU9_9BURK|nr:hypothetical protein [Paracidovorax anthurii]RAR84709.1 hypothetical protein AX018_101061 [Paracidovorax anthurii]
MVSPLSSRGHPSTAPAQGPPQAAVPPSPGRRAASVQSAPVPGLRPLASGGVPGGEHAALRPRQALSSASEGRLRGYVMALAIDGRHLDVGPDLARLRQATATAEKVRWLLPLGRGNVIDDVLRSDHQSSRNVEAGRTVKDALVRRGMPNIPAYAAGGLIARAGNCGEFAAVGILLHVPLLKAKVPQSQEAESIYLVKSQRIEHDWVELRDERGPQYHVVLDPWLRGPAVFSRDSQWGGHPDDFRLVSGYDRAAGLKDRETLDKTLATSTPALQARFRRGLQEVGPTLRYDPKTVYPPMSVVGRGFERRVQAKMSQPLNEARAARWGVPIDALAVPRSMKTARRAVLNDVLAVGVARTMTPGLGIKAAQGEAPELLHAAGHRLRDKGR